MKFFPNPKTFLQIGSWTIQMYAICILIGALIAYAIGQHHFKKMGYAKELLSDYFFGVLIIGIIGARIWYVIFMWNEIYSQDLSLIFKINQGGLAIQGGIIAGLIYSYWFFKKHNVPFLLAGDAILPGVLIAQACGRWGNFFNQEAYGSTVSLAFLKSLHLPQFIIDYMYIGGSYHHPTFLYESVLNMIGFLFIFFLVRRFQSKQGEQFFSYFIWYGIIRFFVESLRTDSLFFMGLKMAQLTSIVFVIVGVGGLIWCKKYGKKAKVA